VNDALADEVIQPREHLFDDFDGFAFIEFVLLEIQSKVHLAILHHHEQAVVLFHDVV
jgi:hypothetical protein